jgi:hypothetical protein
MPLSAVQVAEMPDEAAEEEVPAAKRPGRKGQGTDKGVCLAVWIAVEVEVEVGWVSSWRHFEYDAATMVIT